MPFAAPSGTFSSSSICVRCAFHRRLRSLQQRRWRSSPTTLEATTRRDDSKVFRFTNRRSTSDARDPNSIISYRINNRHPSESSRRNRAHRVPLSPSDGGALIHKIYSGDDEAGEEQLVKWGLDSASQTRRQEQDFSRALDESLKKVKTDVSTAPVLGCVAKDQAEWDGDSGRELGFGGLWKQFTQKIRRGGHAEPSTIPHPDDGDGDSTGDAALWNSLADAFRIRGHSGLEDRLKYAFYGHVAGSRFTASDVRNQKTLADLRYPTEWYPATRALHRTIHLHVGPTNSGKTYHALQRLEQAKKGAYAGPLRLLAHEVYTRLNAKGRKCALVTGEERRIPTDELNPGAYTYDLTSCTVEMMPLNQTLDVAVIDEIQMIGNAERGWAWTQALLGVKAVEVHLCGEERTVPIIQELCASVGEKLIIHKYQRLSPLQVSERSLDGNLKELRKGDCIVSFSVMGIHALRKQIERVTGRKVATVYGSLPPETRAQQARLFNDPNNDYDFLVASDAVGMGLNLAIKRIIFESSTKFNGVSRQTLSVADIKQIGGRAGRFRTAAQVNDAPASEEDLAAAKGEVAAQQDTIKDPETNENLGLITTLERFDFPIVRAAMSSEPEPIKTAGLFPPAPVLERFAGYFPPGTPFSYILTRLHELSQMHSRFHLCGLQEQTWIADLIEAVPGLSISDRNILVSSPAAKADNDMWKVLMPAYARCIAEQRGGNLAEIPELPLEILDRDVSSTREYLRALERLHKGIVVYLWLSYRFAGVFNTRGLAFHVKGLVEEKIEKTLSSFSFSESQRRRVTQQREKDLMAALLAGESAGEDLSVASTGDVESGGDGGTDGGELDGSVATSSSTNDAEYEELIPGSELEGRVDVRDQTSRIAGGDSFAGEEIGLEEPGLEPEEEDDVKEAQASSEEVGEGSDEAKGVVAGGVS